MQTTHKNCLCSTCKPQTQSSSNTYKPDPYPDSMYRSQYMVNYQRKNYSNTSPFWVVPNFWPQEGVDLKSTYQSEYGQKESRPASHNSIRRPESSPEIRYKNSSTYSNNFKKHSVNRFPVMTGFNIDHRRKGLKVSKKTMYSEEFVGKKGSFVKISNPNIKLSCSAQSDFVYPKVTTAQREYKDLSRFFEKQPKFAPFDSSFVMRSCKSQYLTTNQKEFANQGKAPNEQNFELCLKKSLRKAILK